MHEVVQMNYLLLKCFEDSIRNKVWRVTRAGEELIKGGIFLVSSNKISS